MIIQTECSAGALAPILTTVLQGRNSLGPFYRKGNRLTEVKTDYTQSWGLIGPQLQLLAPPSPLGPELGGVLV